MQFFIYSTGESLLSAKHALLPVEARLGLCPPRLYILMGRWGGRGLKDKQKGHFLTVIGVK